MTQSRTAALIAASIALGAAASVAVAASPIAGPSESKAGAAATTLTPEQRQALRAQLARYLRQDSEGLVSRMRADSAVSLELDGRYQHAMFARPRAAGRPELACFDDPDAAVAFLARDDRRAAPATPGARQPAPEERDR